MIGSKAVDLHEPRASLHTPSGGQANQALFPPFPQVLPHRMPALAPHQYVCFADRRGAGSALHLLHCTGASSSLYVSSDHCCRQQMGRLLCITSVQLFPLSCGSA